MRLQKFSHNRQTDPAARLVHISGRIRFKETVKDIFLVFLTDARTLILYRNQNLFLIQCRFHLDNTILR